MDDEDGTLDVMAAQQSLEAATDRHDQKKKVVRVSTTRFLRVLKCVLQT